MAWVRQTLLPVGGTRCYLSLDLVFSDYISPFNLCFKAFLVVLNSLKFCLPVKLLISPSILIRSLLGRVILVVAFSLSVF